MTLVKVNEDIVQVISREQTHFTILTREREVKKISPTQIEACNAEDIKRTINNIKKKKIVYLTEYRILKKHRCA